MSTSALPRHRAPRPPELSRSTWRRVRGVLTAGVFAATTVAGVAIGLNGAAVSPVAPTITAAPAGATPGPGPTGATSGVGATSGIDGAQSGTGTPPDAGTGTPADSGNPAGGGTPSSGAGPVLRGGHGPHR